LDDIITILVRKQVEIMAFFVHNVLNHFLIHLSGVVLQTFLDNVRAELLFGKLDDVTHQLSADDDVDPFYLHFEDELDNVVTKWVFDES
jgi:hypothetical protein